MNYYFSPDLCHEYMLSNNKKVLAFQSEINYELWKDMVRRKLLELLGDMPAKVPLNLRIEYENKHELYDEKRFVFTSEAYADVPCHLLIPKKGTNPFPVVICLQGHSTGMHISLGQAKYGEQDVMSIEGGRDFAIQTVKEGYAALTIEQRCFGERSHNRSPEEERCKHSTMVALLLGRTMICERVWDVSRAIDALEQFPEINSSKIACMGNSGGGTVTYYASCIDERIRISMPSCSVCTFRDSIAAMSHCTDNYLPGILKNFDMGDLSCLIAPRPLVLVAGSEDPIFPVSGVIETFNIIRQIYAAEGVPDLCKIVIGQGGHRFYPEQAWPVFREMCGWE